MFYINYKKKRKIFLFFRKKKPSQPPIPPRQKKNYGFFMQEIDVNWVSLDTYRIYVSL